MLDAVFISDLHLHPEEAEINARFNAFIDWAAFNTKSLYILGDFFHAWAGDDGINQWSRGIAKRLRYLSQKEISVYYIHGNRDFLLGDQFAQLSNIEILPEPVIIQFEEPMMLVHGDRYCTRDKSHMRFRRITRNRFFTKVFLSLPFKFRNKIVDKIRAHSQSNKNKTLAEMDVVAKDMINHMQEKQVKILIHGHTHKPGLIKHEYNSNSYSQFVLSDWDDSPTVLCYDETIGFKFIHPI